MRFLRRRDGGYELIVSTSRFQRTACYRHFEGVTRTARRLRRGGEGGPSVEAADSLLHYTSYHFEEFATTAPPENPTKKSSRRADVAAAGGREVVRQRRLWEGEGEFVLEFEFSTFLFVSQILSW